MSFEPAASYSYTSALARGRLHLVGSAPESAFASFGFGRVHLSALRVEEMLEHLLRAPSQGWRLRVHSCSFWLALAAQYDELLLDALNGADIVVPASKTLRLASRVQGVYVERLDGLQLMHEVLERTRESGARHFFYGVAPEAAETLADELSVRFPGLQVAGVLTAPSRALTWRETEYLVRQINAAEPDYVWAALSSPQQDEWLANFRPLLRAAVLAGVGPVFD